MSDKPVTTEQRRPEHVEAFDRFSLMRERCHYLLEIAHNELDPDRKDYPYIEALMSSVQDHLMMMQRNLKADLGLKG